MTLRSLLVDALYRITTGNQDSFTSTLAAKWLDLSSLRYFLTNHAINVVLDVGANEGQFAAKLRRLGYGGRIISFEPDPRAYARLAARHGGDPLWKGYPFALGDAEAELTFHLGSESVLSSFLESADHARVERELVVPVRRLDSVLAEALAGIAKPKVFLKTDTQGFDLHVLRGASGCLDQVIGILAELSAIGLYEQSPPFDEAIVAYRNAGFDLVNLAVVARTLDGRLLELDGMFVRRSLAKP